MCAVSVRCAGAMNGALSDSGSSRDMGVGVRWDAHGAGGGGGLPVPMTRAERRLVHIKKPLNAFMLFMRDQRAKVMAESSLKESAAINQLLGTRRSTLYTSLIYSTSTYNTLVLSTHCSPLYPVAALHSLLFFSTSRPCFSDSWSTALFTLHSQHLVLVV